MKAFGSRRMLGEDALYEALRARFPHAELVGCSTGGQIAGGDVSDVDIPAFPLAAGHEADEGLTRTSPGRGARPGRWTAATRSGKVSGSAGW